MLKQLLLGIGQSVRWHPEGNVWAHTVLVRKALEPALELWRIMRPNVPFAFLPPLDEEDIHIIKVGAWLHDIGKAAPTDGSAYIQHDNPKVYTPYIEQLRDNPFWRDVIDPIRGELDFIIQHHMKFNKGLSRRLQNRWLDEEGMLCPDRDVLRVLIVRLMDIIGRGDGQRVNEAHDFLLQLGQVAMKFRVKMNRIRCKPRTGEDVVAMMMFKGIAPATILLALMGMLNKGSISSEEYSDIIGRMAAGCTFDDECCDE